MDVTGDVVDGVILIVLLGLPAVGAVLAALLPGRAARWAATVAAAATFGVSLALYRSGWSGGGYWHEFDVSWVPALRLRFHLGVDGISWPLIVLTTLLTLLCCLYSLWRTPDRRLFALLLALEVGILGVFCALDLILFFVFFETVLLPMYAIIAGWGGPRRRMAARKFVLYTLSGSMLLLIGVFLVVTQTGTADLAAPTGTASMVAFAFLAIGFAVKAPLWPLHSWLPDAHSEAPTVGSVLLAGVLLKLGTYGLIRVALPVAPVSAERAAPVIAAFAVAAIVIGGLICLAQTEIKRLIAYSSVGHMGFVVLAVATFTVGGVQAAVFA
ncbi:MAG: NADH-quinone oxidoreductase subunit M, partial [Longispora sp.]|nr:NADH-quinone oxidoreductase subunit M [Longispora sp. (in: high G+C Gram-positive bacteria)]